MQEKEQELPQPQPQPQPQPPQKQPVPWLLIIWLTFIVMVLGVVAIDLLSGGVLIGEIAKLIEATKVASVA